MIRISNKKLKILSCMVLPTVIFLWICATDTWAEQIWLKSSWSFAPNEDGTQSDSAGGVILAEVASDFNFALERQAYDHTGAVVTQVTDGEDRGGSYWDSISLQAINFFLKVDLGENRLVNRIKILPRRNDQAKFIKGYSLQLSTDDVIYHEVALNKFNINPLVDTTFATTLARYVKAQIKAVDELNSTWIGDIQVFGKGHLGSGSYTSDVTDFNVPRPKNFGMVSWKAEIPEGSDLSLQFKTGDTSTPDDTWSDWSEELRTSKGTLFKVFEPRRYLQFRPNFKSSDPRFTPRLKEISIAYSDTLVARKASATVVSVGDSIPNQVEVGKEKKFSYTIKTSFDSRSIGFDKIIISTPNRAEVVALTLGTNEMVAGTDYTATSTNDAIEISLDNPIKQNSTMKLDFLTTLYDEDNFFPSQIVNTSGGSENPQYVDEDLKGSLSIFTTGFSRTVLDRSRVSVKPNPFSPNGDGKNDITEFRYELAKLSVPRDVTIKIFDFSGFAVRKISMKQKTGAQSGSWDGLDDNGKLLPPGIYIYQLKVDADEPVTITGTIVVTY